MKMTTEQSAAFDLAQDQEEFNELLQFINTEQHSLLPMVVRCVIGLRLHELRQRGVKNEG